MRMWLINTELLCRKHLLGSHSELHKFRPSFIKQYRIDGRVYPIAQIEPASMERRHNELAEEMLRRGYNHKSPYKQPDISYLPNWQQNAKVDPWQSINELKRRCPDCRERIEEYEKTNNFTFSASAPSNIKFRNEKASNEVLLQMEERHIKGY